MTWDPHREDEARWIAAMRQRHARGQEYVCGLADVLRTLEERDEARAEVERLRGEIGEAWFADGCDIITALRRKVTMLERLGDQPTEDE